MLILTRCIAPRVRRSRGVLPARRCRAARRGDLFEDVVDAAWAPDGAEPWLSCARRGWRHRLEFPAGKVLYETAGWISHPRVSPKGDLVAFLDHPVFGDDAARSRSSTSRARRRRCPTAGRACRASPGRRPGEEIWFTASRPGSARALHAVTPAGKQTHRARVSHGTGARRHLPRRAGSSAPGQRPGRVLRSDHGRDEGAGPLGSRVVELSAAFRGRKAGRLQRRRRRPAARGTRSICAGSTAPRRCGWARAPPSPSLPTGNGC